MWGDYIKMVKTAISYNVSGVAEVAERSEAIWTKRSEVGNAVLGDVQHHPVKFYVRSLAITFS